MKRSITFVITVAMISMTGCLVTSLHPFYKPGDKVFDPIMAGNWIDSDSGIWTIAPNKITESFMGPEKMDSTYRITYCDEEGEKGIFTGTLFMIKGESYVDFYPDPDESHCLSDLTCWHHVPTHTLARVQYNSDSILIYWFAEEWLNDLFETNRIRIKHETIGVSTGYDRHVLTASTEELQKFIKKYANDPQTSEDIQRTFTLSDPDDASDYGLFLKLKPYQGEIP